VIREGICVRQVSSLPFWCAQKKTEKNAKKIFLKERKRKKEKKKFPPHPLIKKKKYKEKE
jgi:hypothetical protein